MRAPAVLLLGLLGVFFIILRGRDEHTQGRVAIPRLHHKDTFQSGSLETPVPTDTQPASPYTAVHMWHTHVPSHVPLAQTPHPTPPRAPGSHQ